MKQIQEALEQLVENPILHMIAAFANKVQEDTGCEIGPALIAADRIIRREVGIA
jgi:hypothetical protein